MNAMNEQTRAAVEEVRRTDCEFLTVPQVAKILKVNKHQKGLSLYETASLHLLIGASICHYQNSASEITNWRKSSKTTA